MTKHDNFTPQTHGCRNMEGRCPICDGGLALCRRCGAAEIQQDYFPTCEDMLIYKGAQRVLDLFREAQVDLAWGAKND